MRIAFFIVILIHALLHSLGFLKAFGFAEIREVSLPISKTIGLFWLIISFLFALTAFQYMFDYKYWWFTGLVSVIFSQLLLFMFWQDAKWGSIPNLIILAASIIAYGNYSFKKMVDKEIYNLLSNQTSSEQTIIKNDDLTHLPKPVKNWLINSGVVGKPKINTVYLKQNAKIKMKPEDENWTNATAEQYYNTNDPTFIWTVKMKMMSFINVVGRDKFKNGKGEMLIKILSLFPIVNVKENEKINSGTLQRYLGEIVWFPTGALNDYITWEEINDSTAKATMKYSGTKDDGVFHFDQKGNFKKFTAIRYKGGDENSEKREWIIEAEESNELNGIIVPTKLKSTWKLGEKDWTWLKLELTEINYNNLNKMEENSLEK